MRDPGSPRPGSDSALLKLEGNDPCLLSFFSSVVLQLIRIFLALSDGKSVVSLCARNKHVKQGLKLLSSSSRTPYGQGLTPPLPQLQIFQVITPWCSWVQSGPWPVAGNIKSHLMTLKQP